MPRTYSHSHLCYGQLVGFSVKRFAHSETLFACFHSKDGRRLQRNTNQSRIGQAIEAARLLIEKEYEPVKAVANSLTWDHAVERLTARLSRSGNRASTLGYYLKLIRLVRKHYDTTGPGDITATMAEEWRDWIMGTPGRRKKLPSAHYIASLVVGMSSLWQRWFVEDLRILSSNPWHGVEPPKADKLPVKYATDDLIEPFYKWIEERFGEWAFPKLFLSTKAYSGCRLMDLCGLKSGQLRSGRLVFPADLTKGRKERAVPIPKDLFEALDAFKGKTWLWEKYLPGLKLALKARGFPTHQLNPEFSPQRLYFWVETLFADYRKAHSDRPVLTTHMFRKRAFTLAWQAGVDPRRASIAYGCNVDTLMQHYVLMDEQQVTDDVFDQMHESKR